MSLTLAFDVYGTLIDTGGVVTTLETVVGDLAGDFSRSWRDKQLEYSFRRGLMGAYEDFAVCTSQALDYCCRHYRLSLTEAQTKLLLDSYRTLPAFTDAVAGLAQLHEADARLYAFSNGREDAVTELLENAGLEKCFHGIVSCNEVQSFKPNPAVYTHFLTTAGSSASDTWLISSNPFDVIGAMSAGWRAAWVQRSDAAVFDPWDMEPTVTIDSLVGLYGELLERHTR